MKKKKSKKEKNKESHVTPLRLLFILNRNKGTTTKEPRYFSKKNVKTKKNSKMFLKIMHEKTNSKAQNDETQEKQEFLKMIKIVSMIFF